MPEVKKTETIEWKSIKDGVYYRVTAIDLGKEVSAVIQIRGKKENTGLPMSFGAQLKWNIVSHINRLSRRFADDTGPSSENLGANNT